MQVNGKFWLGLKELLTAGLSIYTKAGKMDTKDVRLWMDEVQSDGNGQFVVDWSSAKFVNPPFHVQATAVMPATANVQDRVYADMVSNYNSNNGIGYTTRGNSVLIGGVTTRVAPNCKVHVMAWGRTAPVTTAR